MHFSVVASLLLLATSCFAQTVQPTAEQLAQNDVHVLQYALILENLEYAFYSRFQARFTSQNFIEAGFSATDYSYFNLIRDHEEAHVAFLNVTVPPPTSGCTYNFPVNTVNDYISLAQTFENLGVAAYDGAINYFYNPALVEYAATIATIEARHASYINRLAGQNPFPNAFDQAFNSSTVANSVFGGSSPIATCTFINGFALPQLLVVYPVQNASDPSQPTQSTLDANDVKVLQYALFLEHLEDQFYKYVTRTFTAANFASQQIFDYITLIGQHEAAHVSAISSVISNYGATPLSACTYNFSGIIGTNNNTAIAVAAALEATGVGAYDGAAKSIYNAGLKQVAATIVTVEARHASFINAVARNPQGPVQGAAGPFDIALSFNATFGIVIGTNLIVDCPAYPTAFEVLIVKPYGATSGTTGGSSTGASSTGASSTGASTTGGSTTGTVAPTDAPTDTPTDAPTDAPTDTPTEGPTGVPTVGPTTSPTAAPTARATTGATTARATTGAAGNTTTGATTRGPTTSTTARTSGASIVSASVVVALLVAVAAF